MSWEEIKLNVSDEVRRLLEERHISENEVKQVIYDAETKGEKLYQPETNRYLAKLRIERATFYAEYSIEQGNYVVRSAYAYKSEVKG